MRAAIGAFGLVAGIIVVALVGRYGWATSDTHLDGAIAAFFFATIAIGGIAGPAAAVHVWKASRCWAIITGIVAAVALLANLTNSLGAVAGRSDKTVAERAQAKEGREDAKAELGRLAKERAALRYTPTSAEAVESARAAVSAAERTTRAECGDGDPKQRGKHCRAKEDAEAKAREVLTTTAAQRAATELADRVDGQIADARKRMERAPAVASVNPLADTLGRLLRIDSTTAATGQQIATVVVVELLIALALLMWELLGKGAVTRQVEVVEAEVLRKIEVLSLPAPRREVGDIAKWAVGALEPTEGAALRIASLHEPYARWAEERGEEPVPKGAFPALFRGLCQLSGFAVDRGRVVGLARR